MATYYDIFISYKNDSSGNVFAEKLARDLRDKNYSVYYNREEQRSGDFDERIRAAIATCKDFLIVLSPGCLNELKDERCMEESWVRKEILEARKYPGILFTPIYIDDVRPPSEHDFAHDSELSSFFHRLDGVHVPGDGYEVSPFTQLTKRLVSRGEGNSRYRDVVNSNPSFNTTEVVREQYKLAAQGDFDAMFRIGYMCFHGFYPSKDELGAVCDYKEAFKWLERVARDCPDLRLRNGANVLLATMYYYGSDSHHGKDLQRSLEHYELTEGDGYAMAHAAYMRRRAMGCDFDYARTEQSYQAAIKRGDNITWFQLARFYEEHGDNLSAIHAYESMRPITPVAHMYLGRQYANGNHVNPPMPDYAKAALHFRIAMQQGNTRAAYELGQLYFYPAGEFQGSYEQAELCYRIAATNGHMNAQYQLGVIYEYDLTNSGLDRKARIDKAIRYYRQACENGSIMAAKHLATLYQLPEHCNFSLAFTYCEKAARSGDAMAQFMLGTMLLMGRGCEHDADGARDWLRKSLENGYSISADLLKLMDQMDINDSDVPSWL